MSVAVEYEWQGRELVAVDSNERHSHVIEVADSFLVSDGCAIAIARHRERFLSSATLQIDHLGGLTNLDLDAFWNAALTLIPAKGDWFPRIELRSRQGHPELAVQHRTAPPRSGSLTLITHLGGDPRRFPSIKGPDLESLLRLKAEAKSHQADEPVLVSSSGAVVDGATSAIAWWRGDVLCMPPVATQSATFARVDSVTAQCLIDLVTEHGIEVRREHAAVASLEGAEVWALNALHGIRVATHWVDGPMLTQIPGRLELWRERHLALRRSIGVPTS